MEIRLLGPLEIVRADGRAVVVGPPAQRALLVLLALRPGEVAPVRVLVDGLWGEDPPARAVNMVQGYVSRLRRALGAEAAITTVAPGYRLEIAADSVDAVRFERATAQGRAAFGRGDVRGAAEVLGVATGWCRGTPLAEFADYPFSGPETIRLDRLIRAGRADWAKARLELGDHVDLVPELERLVAYDRFNEAMWATLMVALYRSGRQADALAVFKRARGILVEELGVEPGPELRRVEAEVLRQDVAVSAPPRGLVTFVLTDVEGSTQRWERDPAAMADALAQHDRIVAEAVERHRGLLRKSRGEGDSTFSVFGRAGDAVAAALDLARTMCSTPWPDGMSLAVRVVVHTGEAELRDGDYYGSTVNRAARVRAACRGGQVLVTESSAVLVRDCLPAGAGLADLGQHRLKDIDRPERLYQLNHPDLPREFAALSALEAATNLPERLTSFIGRDAEVAEVTGLLERSRLVTLTGPGGCGKTSLALRAAAISVAAGAFPDGVWFVDLSTVADAGLVAAAVAAPLGVRAQPGRSLADSLAEYLGGRRALIVLDNCEHLADASATLVEQLLSGGPAVRVLATSRERLDMPGEAPWTAPPLAEPDGVRLFLERARAVAPDSADEHDAAAVGKICRRLDGIPLAIELAAARVNVLTVRQIAERLDDALRLLGQPTRRASARQRTLRATIEWSYQLLSAPEQALFDRLAVFAGGFTLAAAEAVGACAAVDHEDVVGYFARLVDKSLVLRVPADEGELRYRLLETLRQYARARLQETGQLAAAEAAHAAYFLRFAEEAETHLYESGGSAWHRRLAREAANFRATLTWSFAERSRVGTGARLVGALGWAWFLEGRIAEGRSWADTALAATAGEVTFHRGRLLCHAGALASAQSDLAAFAAHCEEARQLGEHLGSGYVEADASAWLGMARWAQGDLDAARSLLADGLQRMDHPAEDVHALAALGPIWTNYLAMVSVSFTAVLSRVLVDAGQGDEAATILSQARSAGRALGEDFALGFTLDVSAATALDRGDLPGAAEMIEEALSHYDAVRYQEGLASGLNTKGLIDLTRGNPATAMVSFRDALGLCRRLGHLGGFATALEGLASVSCSAGDARRGARLLAAADAIRDRVGAPVPAHLRPTHEKLRAALTGGLGEEGFAAAWATGQGLSLDQAVDVGNFAAGFSELPAVLQRGRV